MTKRVQVAFVFLCAAHLAALLAGALAPYPYEEQHRDFPLAPPSRIHFVDAAGAFHARPFVYGLAPDGTAYHEDTARQYPLQLFAPSGGIVGVAPPGVFFPLGTDAYGRDILSRVLYGARISLFTGLLSASLSLAIGALAGVTAGFFGGWVDRSLMQAAELTLTLPWLYLLLAVRAALPLHISGWQVLALLVGIIGGIGWARPSRVVRGVALSARDAAYVRAAEGFGASAGYLIWRHILPETSGVLLTQATILVPQYIRAEVSLSFLGLGAGEPTPTWGNMLSDAMRDGILQHPWLLAPGVAALAVLLAYLALADALTAKP
jgi:peptide/nickel transport system permease protein